MKKNIKHIKAITLFLVILLQSTQSVFSAPGIEKFEQQINISNGEFSTTNATDSPTDNSLGLIDFDSANYDGDTVYFEAVIRCDTCTGGGNNRVTASLYSDTGGLITTVNTTSSSYIRVRSGSLSMSADEYTVRFKRDDDTGTAYIKAARLVIAQSGTGGGITDTQTHVEVGSYESNSASSATEITAPKYYVYDHGMYSGTINSYFEATIKASSGSTTTIELYNKTNSAVVATITTTSTSYVRVRSAALSSNWDTTNDDEYSVRMHATTGTDTAYIGNAKIVIDQTQIGGIESIEMPHQYITSARTQTNTTYTQDAFINQYDPGNFNTPHTLNIFHESTMKTSANTGYIELYNVSDTDPVNNATPSELTTTSASFERQVSSDLSDNTDWPSAAKNLTPTLKASSSQTTTVSSSRILIQIINIEPTLTFQVEGEASGNTHNGITTNIVTTPTQIDFGNITPGAPYYGAHKLTINTNDAFTSFQVTLKLAGTFQGIYPANHFDPFVGSSATWSSPQLWVEPTGTVKNVDTGWFGANTTDTDVTGWASATSKFGPVSTSEVIVMQSNTAQTEVEYVSYAIEANVTHAADLYSATITYDVTPTF